MAGIAVIDSNVIVAGLLTGNSESPTAKVLDGMLASRFAFALSMELLSEYHRVLRYPKVARLHGLEDAAINDLLTELTLPAVMVAPPEVDVAAPDPGDAFLFRLLAALDGGVLVTGDRALLDGAPGWAQVVTPATFAASRMPVA